MHRWCTPPAMSNLYRCYRTVSTLDRQQWAEPQGEQQHSWFFAKSWKLFFFLKKKTKKFYIIPSYVSVDLIEHTHTWVPVWAHLNDASKVMSWSCKYCSQTPTICFFFERRTSLSRSLLFFGCFFGRCELSCLHPRIQRILVQCCRSRFRACSHIACVGMSYQTS